MVQELFVQNLGKNTLVNFVVDQLEINKISVLEIYTFMLFNLIINSRLESVQIYKNLIQELLIGFIHDLVSQKFVSF